MEESLTSEDIEFIHDMVVERFNITKGTLNKSTLDAVVQRPNVEIKGGPNDNYTPFDNVYTKAAGIMESIIRWHPFADGNKRTALLTVMYYLFLNNYAIVLPLS